MAPSGAFFVGDDSRKLRVALLQKSAYPYIVGALQAVCLDFVGAIQPACLANSDWIIANSLRLIRSHRGKSSSLPTSATYNWLNNDNRLMVV